MARGVDAQVEAALAKKFSAEMAARSVIACMQAMGAVGLLPRYGFGRLMTSARIAAYVDGTTEMQNERIGAALFKRYGVFLEIRPDPPGVSGSTQSLDNRRASLSLPCHLVDNLASVERVLGRGRSIGQRLFIDLAELHLVRTAPCLIPAQVDVMHDPI